jgi:hypothetical protein
MTMPASTWAPQDPGTKYGFKPQPSSTPSELAGVPSPKEGAAVAAQPWNPSNPLFAFAVIGAVTFGLMAFSTSVRVGGTKAALSIGDTK